PLAGDKNSVVRRYRDVVDRQSAQWRISKQVDRVKRRIWSAVGVETIDCVCRSSNEFAVGLHINGRANVLRCRHDVKRSLCRQSPNKTAGVVECARDDKASVGTRNQLIRLTGKAKHALIPKG